MKGIREMFSSPRQTGRSLCRCSLCFSNRVQIHAWAAKLGIWLRKKPSLSVFPPSVAHHFSSIILSLVHSEAGLPEEAWSHSSDSATELMTAGFMPALVLEKNEWVECLHWPQTWIQHSPRSHDRIDLSSHYVIPMVQAFLCHLVIPLYWNLNGYDCKGY